jgi:hypothetical protein
MRLVAGFSPRRLGFELGSVHMGFILHNLALRQIFLRVIRFSPVSIMPPLFNLQALPANQNSQPPRGGPGAMQQMRVGWRAGFQRLKTGTFG